MSIVFLGTSEFAAAILERLAGSKAHRPALVLTRPDRPRGRGRRSASPPVAGRARALGIPLEQPERINDPQARQRIAQASPDVVVVCAFGALIKEPLLSEHELLNVHPSLLPRWRGAAPIERAIMAGDARTGVSIMRLTVGLDSGPVCLAESEPIGAEDTYGALAPRLQGLGAELLLRVLDLKAQGRPLAFAEQAVQGVTYAEKIGSEDRLLDPVRAAIELDRVVRALEPHIGARVALADGTLLGVHRAALAEPDPPGAEPDPPGAEPDPPGAEPDPPGAETANGRARADDEERGMGVVSRNGRLMLDCSPGTLELLVVQPPGGRAMDAASYLRGHGLPVRR